MENLNAWSFLTNGFFVVSWYLAGLILAIWVLYDVYYVNTAVSKPLKTAFPIIIIFFSIIGLVMYLLTCRPKKMPFLKPKISSEDFEAKYHSKYVSNTFSKVTGSVMHCTAGDGLGILTAMVVGTYIGLGFWNEFIAEYIIGFLFGWLLFQYPAMRSMGLSSSDALWKGGRAEFFSMITMMGGMLFTMLVIIPYVLSSMSMPMTSMDMPMPMPDTYAFWGVAWFGLLIGTIVPYPMNWWLVSIGWKHGMQ